MSARRPVIALLAAAFVVSTLYAGGATAGSHFPLSVQLWNDSAEGLGFGNSYTVWAQVRLADAPANATNVTFRVGLGVISTLFPATNYTGVYAGSPGLYRATASITVTEAAVGLTAAAVFVRQGNDTANTMRIISFSSLVTPPAAGQWSLTAGVENLAALGKSINPGEKIVWRIDTFNGSGRVNAPSLKARLFAAPNVEFIEAPLNVTLTSGGTGIYMAETQIPAALTESRQYVLQAELNESSYFMANASADVTMLEAVVAYSQHDGYGIGGELSIGDGVSALANADVALQLTERGVPSHFIGAIQGQSDPLGKFAFSVPNDGTLNIDVRGWINDTGTRSQYIAGSISLAPTYIPPSPDGTRFDAIPQVDLTTVVWDQTQTVPFQFYDNGSLWANSPVVALISTSRGPITTAVLNTNATGMANLTVNFGSSLPHTDDFVQPGINFTFRAATGNDTSSSDARWWGEDEERAMPDVSAAGPRMFLDTNLSFTTEQVVFDQPFGVGFKYTGAKNLGSYKGATVLSPAGLQGLFGGFTPGFDLWTGHGQAFVGIAVRGSAPEYFGSLMIPSYWPNTTYGLIGALVSSYSFLGSGGDATMIGALNWTTVTPGQALNGFTPSPDVTPPQIGSPEDMTVDLGTTVYLWSNSYDDSLDFGTVGQYEWTVGTGGAQVVLDGNGQLYTPGLVGDVPVSLKVTDGAGHFSTHAFVIHVVDAAPPSVDAGPDFVALGGVVANITGTAADNDPAFNGGATINWTFTYNGSSVTLPGLQAYPSASASFTFWTLGNYTLTMSAMDPSGHTASDTVNVSVVSPDTVAPTVSAGADRTELAGIAASFNGTAFDNDANFPRGASCGWTFTYNGSSPSFNGSAFNFTFWTLGGYDLRYFCLDFWGNLGQDTVRVTVERPDQVAPVVLAGADMSTMTGQAVFFSGSATDNDPNFDAFATYWWIVDDQGTPHNLSGAAASYTFTAGGDFSVTLYARDGWGNVGSDTLTVHVGVPDTTRPTFVTIADRHVLTGVLVQDTSTATDDDPSFTTTGNISWAFTYAAAPVHQYGTQFSFTFDTAGTYLVTVRATDGAGNFAETTFNIFVTEPVVPDTTPPTVTASANQTSVVAGGSVTFAGAATDSGLAIVDGARFNWTFTVNGTPVVLHGSAPSYTFTAAGTYTVTLTVMDAAGNAGTAQTTVTVTQPVTQPPPVTTPSDPTLLILVALLAAGAVGAFLVLRRRGPAAEPREGGLEQAKKPGIPTKPVQGPAAPQNSKPGEGGAEDKDLDDLLN